MILLLLSMLMLLRRQWGRLLAGPALGSAVALVLLATCAGKTKPATFPTGATITYLHTGVAPGPVLITDQQGAVVEERRYEPYGVAIDAWRGLPGEGGGATVAGADVGREPLNVLNKETDPRTGFSYHGARWMAPQWGGWVSPDPAVKGPSAEFMLSPWDLNPYAYVRQNPTLYWDPDGRESVRQAIERKVMEAGAGGGGWRAYAWSAVGGLWEGFGAESLSRVVDSHMTGDTKATALDYVGAALDASPLKSAATGAKASVNFVVKQMAVKTGGSKAGAAVIGVVRGGGGAARFAANWKSVKTFQHTFSKHGAGLKATRSLTDTARATGKPQGQWLDNDAAAQLLQSHRGALDGPASIRIPSGMGQVIMPDGSIVSATRATLVPGPNGFATAYPIP